MLRQAKIQSDSTHRLWLRNHQQQAFEELLISVRRWKDLLAGPNAVPNLPRLEDGSVDLGAYLEEQQVRSTAASAAVTRVTLLADLETGSAAFTLGLAMSNLGLAVMRHEVAETDSARTDAPTEEALHQLWVAADTATTDFALKAQQTLQKI
ncbi:hypothetical protein [[Kitasatospora] papulosa]|uniref:hypothetical protein n=1 Tax=[Kitasatospora] papulosa TaxID=1464011 RepID=UPI003640F4D1